MLGHQCSDCPRFAQEEPIQIGFCAFVTCPHHWFEHLLTFWHSKMPQALLHLSYPALEIRHFSENP